MNINDNNYDYMDAYMYLDTCFLSMDHRCDALPLWIAWKGNFQSFRAMTACQPAFPRSAREYMLTTS